MVRRRSTRNYDVESDVQQARESINQIRRVSMSSIYGLESTNSEKRWRLSYLKNQFVSLDLNELFDRYTQRLGYGYFSLFLILQIILSCSHLSVVLVTNMDSNTVDVVVPDLIMYAILTVLPVVGLFFSEKFIKTHPKCLRYMSCLAFSLIYFTNFSLPVYHTLISNNQSTFRPAYTTHLIIAVYVFLNVHDNLIAFILGLSVSITHVLILILITYKDSSVMLKRVLSDVFYLMCVNGLGIYFRFMNEIVKRRGFLDRRACIETTLQLNFEREQKEQLMLSILPEHIIEEERNSFINTIEHFEKTDNLPNTNPFEIKVNEHNNVTILYADIVNYTEMTTKLKPVTKLVETLNELFGRFDDASEELNVLRIKFLGDCYYCVAGLTQNSDQQNHAEACVDLGLKMIKIIRSVRASRNLSIDMRIGVHSGSVISGTIGKKKCQFDVWSNDVDIANKMEGTGKPGMIHITHKTKELLVNKYNIQPSDAGLRDEFLIKNGIQTFLITDSTTLRQVDFKETVRRTSDGIACNNGRKLDVEANDDSSRGNKETKYTRRPSGNPTLSSIGRHASSNPVSTNYATRSSNSSVLHAAGRRSGSGLERRGRLSNNSIFRRTAFMDNNILKYNQRLKDIDANLKEAIESMPLSKYEQWFKVNKINPLLLLFKNWQTELQFLKISDPLFKYYLLSEIVLLICVIIIQTLSVKQWDWWSWFSLGTAIFIAFILLPTTWTHFVWNRFVSNPYDDEAQIETCPKNAFVRFLYKTAEIITDNVIIRMSIYLIVCFLFVVCVFAELIECKGYQKTIVDSDLSKTESLVSFLRIIFFNSIDDNQLEFQCVIPWHMTETCALAIMASFLFLRIHVWIKLFITTGITILYSYCVSNFSDRYYQNSETYNYMMKSQIAHIICMVYLTFTLHLIDRQTDYMNRLDHLWNIQLIDKQREANFMHKFNTIILNTILPEHVAKYYLNMNRTSNELYHENYKSAAVMFASIIVDRIDEENDRTFLVYMNQVIETFDQILSTPNGKPIEKIKVAKWTYMAACGLESGRQFCESEDQVVVKMLMFAADMFKHLGSLNSQISPNTNLRIGIAHGELAAGVVGSKKPLYDIWGDPVNMASRMDSTGVIGRIQVPEDTARVIMRQSIKCEFRGEIEVKNMSNVPTYFVSLDENNTLIKEEQTLL